MSVGVEENRGDEEEGHRHHGRQAAEQREQKLQKSHGGVEEARARTTGREEQVRANESLASDRKHQKPERNQKRSRSRKTEAGAHAARRDDRHAEES